jgi:hypothetical protein
VAVLTAGLGMVSFRFVEHLMEIVDTSKVDFPSIMRQACTCLCPDWDFVKLIFTTHDYKIFDMKLIFNSACRTGTPEIVKWLTILSVGHTLSITHCKSDTEGCMLFNKYLTILSDCKNISNLYLFIVSCTADCKSKFSVPTDSTSNVTMSNLPSQQASLKPDFKSNTPLP